MRAHWPAAAALLMAAQPAIADKPRKVAIAADSRTGALLFKLRAQPVGHQLVFARNGKSSFWSVGHRIFIEAGGSDRFIVEALPPGEYRLNAVHQQQAWAACLEARTLTVTVKAGEIAYVGMLDTDPTLASIQRNARLNKDLTARTHQLHLYRAGVAPPLVSGRDAGGLAEAASFARQEMPKSAAPVRLADLRWGPFDSSTTHKKLDACG